MSERSCPFCNPEAQRLFYAGDLVLGLWDAFPVSPGHALLVTKRHVASWFEASEEERAELIAAIKTARQKILKRHQPNGFNIGVNVGESAGQTVPHLHLHVIPRFDGDVDDPRGGVRWVVPEKANYLKDAEPAEFVVAEPSVRPPKDGHHWPHDRALVSGGSDPLLAHLELHLADAIRADIAVAFILRSGLDLLEPRLLDFLENRGQLRLLAGDYLDVTDPAALRRLVDLRTSFADQVELKVFETASGSFHPKAYIFRGRDEQAVALIGSSNVTRPALTSGVEWNYRTLGSRDSEGFGAVVEGFEALWRHPKTRTLSESWIDAYEARRDREQPPTPEHPEEVAEEAPAAVPESHPIQKEALAALEATRQAGNSAGLVVLATGLGKTWLSAFDADPGRFRRVLFVAHREEILDQALRTFRRIRPHAHLGHFTGQSKSPDADVIFASVQALSRQANLTQFAPDAFDYIVIDEFHHASARTYRKLIDYFEPAFLLGLTATPERTDGGDLLALCQENLVYRCDVAQGIERELLSPFKYYGVPDEVDYAQIPWRSNRFDEEALTQAVATLKRADNAYEQWREKGGERTLAFCCSVRHSNFMRNFFRDKGVRCAAVHSGEGSDLRSNSLEKLESGELQVVFAVDMFNEGVDLPSVDTVMMLRPTESRLLWLQQFGRGLRRIAEKTHLRVIDYIGNHRIFLIKVQALFSLDNPRDGLVRRQLELVREGRAELPPGCEVTYDLEAIDILESVLRSPQTEETLQFYYVDFEARRGDRPTATEAFHDGYNPRASRKSFGSWLRFVDHMGGLDQAANDLVKSGRSGAFLDVLETTPMTRSFKMLVLLAALNADAFPGEISIGDLASGVRRLAQRSATLRIDLGVPLDDTGALIRLLEQNPIAAWVGGKGTGGTSFFGYEMGVFMSRLSVDAGDRQRFQELVRETVDWRLAEYLARDVDENERSFVCRVSHASGRPILFLPPRETTPGVPSGWVPVSADDEEYEANFVKVAVNVMRRPGAEDNELPRVLHSWFGEDAGRPGTNHRVTFAELGDGWRMEPAGLSRQSQELVLWESYQRSDLPAMFGLPFKAPVWNQGFVPQPQNVFLFVTLDKSSHPDEHKYADRFVNASEFEWVSQNRTAQGGKHGQMIRHHLEKGLSTHLFVRKYAKELGRVSPFTYCGELEFVSWQGEKPITVQWRLRSALPPHLFEHLKVS